jgi:asparagine synthase (glutamine-hydrolysing)
MCGIAGIISPDPDRVSPGRLKAMGDALAHRGPDGEGRYLHQEGPFHAGFAHRRLAILDTSPAAAQPFAFGGRHTIVHNGELYNYQEIRQELQRLGVSFRSHGDTEVIVAAYAQWGAECLPRFDGMFAFAIWDERDRTLFIARDRFGEKPLYYHFDDRNGELVFASESGALAAAGVTFKPDLQMVFQYLTLGIPYIQGETDRSFHAGIRQLPPASYLIFETGKGKPWIQRYWDLDKSTSSNIDERSATERFTELLDLSVRRRLRSDVPLGTSLSGGLDSSSIIARCKKSTSGSQVHRSFSAIFPGFIRDESESILDIADAFGLNATLTEPTAEGLLEHLAAMVRHQEMPPSSASVFAQYTVYASVAATDVKVLLDGQGADETLGGYKKYSGWYLQELFASRQFSLLRKEKSLLKENGFLQSWGPLNRMAALMPAMAAQSLEQRARSKQRNHHDLQRSFVDLHYDASMIHKPVVNKLNDILYADAMEGGLQELLHYADRNSMAFGREVRLPFLSHELVEFIFSLPSSLKMRDGYTKWILRSALQDSLPDSITWRKGKTGFEPPQREWMGHPSVQASIHRSKQKLLDLGILNDHALKKKIQPHDAYAAGGMDWRYWMAGVFLNV